MKELDNTFRIILIYICIILFFCSLIFSCQAKADDYLNFSGFHLDMNFAPGSGRTIETVKEDIIWIGNNENTLVRLQVFCGNDENKKVKATQENIDAYNNCLAIYKLYVDELIPYLEFYKIHFIIDLHDLPSNDVFTNPKWRSVFYAKYNNLYVDFCWSSYFLGVDINEPRASGYNERVNNLTNIANAACPSAFAVIEAERGKLENLCKLPRIRGKAILSFHDYVPHSVTFQGLRRWGIRDSNNKLVLYPSKSWNKETRKKRIKKYIDRCGQGKKIYVGEFAATRTSGGSKSHNAYNWVRDSVEIYEELGFMFSYLEFRSRNDADFWDALHKGRDFNDRTTAVREEFYRLFNNK